MQDSRHHAFTAETVEGPEQHAVELALVSIFEQGGELLAVLDALPARVLVDVLVDDLVTSAPLP